MSKKAGKKTVKKKYNARNRKGKARGEYKKNKVVELVTEPKTIEEEFRDDSEQLNEHVQQNGAEAQQEEQQEEQQQEEQQQEEQQQEEQQQEEQQQEEQQQEEQQEDNTVYTTSNELFNSQKKKQSSDSVDGQVLFTIMDTILMPIAKKTYAVVASKENKDKIKKTKNENLELTDPQKENMLKSPSVSNIVEKLFYNMNPWGELLIKGGVFYIANIKAALNDNS